MQIHVLIIEEQDSLCSTLGGALIADGHKVTCLSGLRDAFQTAREQQPDMMVLDISSPRTGAVEIMQRLHRDRQTRNIPVVVVADTTDLEYELQHAFDFILKPVDMARMREDIAMLTKGEKKRSASIRIEHLSESDYKLFHDYLVAFSGLHYERRNQKLLERGLLNRMTSLRITSYLDYFDYLIEHHDNRQELQKLLQQLTIGETYFFRYNAHYLTLKRLLNGELAADPKKRVRIWSAGCSTGEEPYSIAMTIMEIFPDWRERDIRVIATDINNRSLRRAREGVYSQWAMRVIDHHYVDRYFRVVDNRFHIRDEVKQLVDFSHLNLQTANFPVPGGEISNIDVIFCRNVMMYFSLSTIKEIVGKFASSLTANGHFFLGHAETLSHVSSQFERHTSDGGFYYRKRNQQQQASVQREKRVVRERPQLRAVPRQPEPPKPKVEPVVVVSSPPKGTEELFHEAMELFDTENFTAAAKHVEEVLKKEPEHCGAMVLSGFMLANSGNIDEALAICQKVLAINDLLPEAYYLQGLVHDIADQCAEALAEYRKAVLLNMEFLMAHHNLWRLYMRLGKEQQGLRELRTCLKILERTDQEMVVPFSGGLTREVFLEQLRHALANVA